MVYKPTFTLRLRGVPPWVRIRAKVRAEHFKVGTSALLLLLPTAGLLFRAGSLRLLPQRWGFGGIRFHHVTQRVVFLGFFPWEKIGIFSAIQLGKWEADDGNPWWRHLGPSFITCMTGITRAKATSANSTKLV